MLNVWSPTPQPFWFDEGTVPLYAPPLPAIAYGLPGSVLLVGSNACTSYVSVHGPLVVHDSVRFSDIRPLFFRIVPVVLRLVAPATFRPPSVHVGPGNGAVCSPLNTDVALSAPEKAMISK